MIPVSDIIIISESASENGADIKMYGIEVRQENLDILLDGLSNIMGKDKSEFHILTKEEAIDEFKKTSTVKKTNKNI